MIKRLLFTGAVCAVTAVASRAADNASVRYDTDGEYDRTLVAEHETSENWMAYKANEFDFSAFATGRTSEKRLHSVHHIERGGRLGGGAGLSYFFCRYVGIEGYAYTDTTHHEAIDNVAGDLILRWPILETGLAPYIFGGGGRQFDPVTQWTWDAGAGLEWRFASHAGIFADGRYVFADKSKDYGLARLGLKFGF